jgi:hypothetical protein
MPLNWNTFTALTRRKHIPVLADNIYKSNPLFILLDKGDRIVYDGGTEIHEPILAGQQPTQWYQGFDTLNITPVDPIMDAIWQWRLAMASVTVDGQTEVLNSGVERVLSVIESLMMNAEMTLKDQLGVGTFSDGTNTLMMDGLQEIMGVQAGGTGQSPPTYAGISRVTNTFWRTQFLDSAGGDPTFTLFQQMYGLTTQGDTSPDLIVVTQPCFNKLWAQALPQQRYDGGDEVIVGWQHIRFNRARIVVDSHCPAGQAFFLNTQFLKLVVHRDRDFAFTGWMPSLNVDARTGRIHWVGNMCCNNLRFQGIIVNLNET